MVKSEHEVTSSAAPRPSSMPCTPRSSTGRAGPPRTCWSPKSRSRPIGGRRPLGRLLRLRADAALGLDATAPHLTWDDWPFNKDEGTFFELGGCYRRYHAPLSRTVYLGNPPQKFLDAESAVSEATDAGLEMCKPGITCGEVAEAFFDTLKKRGFQKDSRAGYSIGLSYPPDWGERTLSIRRGDKTVLEANMTLHFMPALGSTTAGSNFRRRSSSPPTASSACARRRASW